MIFSILDGQQTLKTMRYKTVIILAGLLGSVSLMTAFMPAEQKKETNLKVLPKNISHDDLRKVMSGFNTALGVKCNFCHAANSDDPKKLDFTSDAKPEKEIARDMMRMTSRINKKYFHLKNIYEPKAVLAVNCITCHNGKAHPEAN